MVSVVHDGVILKFKQLNLLKQLVLRIQRECHQERKIRLSVMGSDTSDQKSLVLSGVSAVALAIGGGRWMLEESIWSKSGKNIKANGYRNCHL